MKELNDLPDISLRTADDPSCVSVCFMVSRVNDVELPSQFLVKVPRYYPHHSPLVYCIQKEFACPIIDPHSHEVFHSQLQSGWSAIGTLRTVLFILEDVRMQYIYNEFKVKPPISESPASAHVLHRHKDTHCASVTPIFVGAENDIENGADFQMTEN